MPSTDQEWRKRVRAAEWTLYQDVTDARDRVEDLTEDYDAWKYEQAQAIVRSS